MAANAWLILRQADEALRTGRLDEAQRLLADPAVCGQKGHGDALKQLVRGLADRAQKNLDRDDAAAAWVDLSQAEKLGIVEPSLDRLRETLTRLGMAEARAALEAGQPARALEAAERLRDRGGRHPNLTATEQAARDWALAVELADRGEFALARQTADRVGRCLPAPLAGFERFRNDLERRQSEFARLLQDLDAAVDQRRWREVVLVTDQLLALAPQADEPRRARKKAWQVLEPITVPAASPGSEHAHPLADAPAERFLLWIDGVGGFLVCLANRVTLGQATTDTLVEVPLVADVSRQHAALTRDSEGYLLEAIRPVRVNGSPTDKALLKSGDRITLGATCELKFTQAVSISATARLDLTSGHRLPLAVDAVVLMAEALVLGPGPQTHVMVPELAQTVTLYRHKDGLGVRWPGAFTLDNRPVRDRGTLTGGGRATGEGLAFTVEPLRRRNDRW